MNLFVVMDKMLLGKGVFGVFSTHENAMNFTKIFEEKTGNLCEVRVFSVAGRFDDQTYIFAVHSYDVLHDSYIVDGLYVELLDAHEAVGQKGLILKIFIDVPDQNQSITLINE